MKTIIMNKNNLSENDIQEKKTFNRFIFLNENFDILVNNKKDFYYLPTDISSKQDIFSAIVKDVNKQNSDELQNIKLFNFEKNHIKRNGKATNRLTITYYFISSFPENINLTKYEIVPLSNLNIDNTNMELLEISNYISQYNKQKTKVK